MRVFDKKTMKHKTVMRLSRRLGSRASSHYEIPINSRLPCSRKPMCRVAIQHPIRTRGPLLRASRIVPQQEHPMLDIVMLALSLAFFALAVGYTYACERL
jgi:hypothetical protein